jgi:hypothetical protein
MLTILFFLGSIVSYCEVSPMLSEVHRKFKSYEGSHGTVQFWYFTIGIKYVIVSYWNIFRKKI